MRFKIISSLFLAAVALIATVASVPAPIEAVSDHGSDAPTKSRTISLGSVDAPESGAKAQLGQPTGVPLADGIAQADHAPERVLRRTENDATRFSAVGVSWKYEQGSVTSVALRTKARPSVPSRPWSAWHATTAEATGRTAERDGTGLIWTGSASAIDVVVTSVRGTPTEEVRIDLIDPGRRVADATAAAPEITLRAGHSKLDVRSRSQWGADEKLMNWTPKYTPQVAAVVVHHTATTTDYSADQVPAILRSIYRYQAVERGWGDVGYNIIVDKFGRAWEGRAGGVDKAVIGAHALGFNTGTSGVALIGNYVSTAPSPASLEIMSRVIAYKLGAQGVKPTDTVTLGGGPGPRHPAAGKFSVPAVMGHDVVGRTACPGHHFDAALSTLRERATALIGAAPKLTTTATD